MDLTGKAALLTGGRRMGVALAACLASAGVDVAFSYRRSRGAADQAAEAVRKKGRKGIALEADLSTPSAAATLVNQSAAALGRLDIVVHLASTYRQTPFDELSDDDWSEALDVDLTAAFRLTRAAVPHLRAAGGGRIVTISDWTAASGRPRYEGYLPYYVAYRSGGPDPLRLHHGGNSPRRRRPACSLVEPRAITCFFALRWVQPLC